MSGGAVLAEYENGIYLLGLNKNSHIEGEVWKAVERGENPEKIPSSELKWEEARPFHSGSSVPCKEF
jgi:hypothetical protein